MKNTFKYTLLSTTILSSTVMASLPLDSTLTPNTAKRAGIVRTPDEVARRAAAGDYDGTPVTRGVRATIDRKKIHEENMRKKTTVLADARTAQALLDEQERTRELIAQLRALNGTMTNQQTEIDCLNQQIATLRQEKLESALKIEELKNNLEAETNRALTTELQIKEITQETAESEERLTQQIIALMTQEKVLAETVTTTTSDNTAKEEALRELHTQHERVTAELTAVKESRDRNITLLTSALDEATQTTEGLTRNLATAEAQRDAKEQTIQQLAAAIALQTAAQEEARRQIEALKGKTDLSVDLEDVLGDTAL